MIPLAAMIARRYAAPARLGWAAVLALGAVVAGPAGATTWFGLLSTGELYVSANQGLAWTIRSTLPVRDAVALVAGATSSELYLASRSGVVYRSLDAGLNWSAVGTIAEAEVVDLVIRADLSLLVLTSGGSLYRSTNQGVSFTAFASLTGPDFVSLGRTTPSEKLYALTRSGSVYESLDGGATWTARGAFTASDAVELRAVGATLYTLTGTGDVYRSVDAGASFTAVGTLSQVGMTALARDGPTLFASTTAGEVATSNDGASWLWKGVMNQLTLTALGVDTPATTGVEPTVPGAVAMGGPWPNPAHLGDPLAMTVSLPADRQVTLELFDLGGRQVASRLPEVLPAGSRTVEWSPSVPAGGLYFLRLRTSQRESVLARVVLVR